MRSCYTQGALLGLALLLPTAALAESKSPPPVTGKDVGIRATGTRPASREAPSATRWALLVGVGRTTDETIPPLPFAVQDTRDLAEVLTEAGYQVVRLSDDVAEDALKPTRNNTLVQAQRLLTADERVQPDHTVLVYFSGHGFTGTRGAFLATSDTWVDRAEDTAVKVSELRALLEQCRAARKVLVLDACHSGAGRGEAAPAQEADQLNLAATGEGMVLMASCRGSEKSWPLVGVTGHPDERNSAYTHFWMKGLRGQADVNRDGEVVLSELSRYVHDSVTAWAQGRQLAQTPRIMGDLEGDISLAGRPEPGRLAVNAEPWAEVFVDGQLRGRTPRLLLNVPAGRHVISFRNPAYAAPIEREVVVKPGEPARLSVTFPKRDKGR